MLTPAERRAMIEKIRQFPAQLEAAVKDLSVQDLTTAFRPGEWTVAQNVHHVADSHMNAYVRMRLILTEDHPQLKDYNQDEWAKLPDAHLADVTPTLALLKGLHARWCLLWDNLQDSQWTRLGFHPGLGHDINLDDILTIYSGHGEGHIRQIQETLAAKKA